MPSSTVTQPSRSSVAHRAGPPAPLSRRIVVSCVLLMGLIFTLLVFVSPGGPWEQGVVLALAAIAAAIAPIRIAVASRIDRLKTFSSRRRATMTLFIAVVAGIYLYLTAWLQASDFMLKLNDEFSYMIQMRMLAHGRLWMPPLAENVREFFESFQILVEPKYASIYFPGTALLYLPTIWLGLPFWILPLVVSAAAVGLLYRVTAELIDDTFGLLAALLLVSLVKFRALSVMLMSQTPMLLFALLIVLFWIEWRRRQSFAWAVAIGVVGGFAAITRPVETICFALPVAAAMFRDMPRLGLPRAAATIGLISLAAAPFLVLQFVQNKGITGRWSEFASDYYVARTYPAPMIGFHKIDWDHIPAVKAIDKKIMNESVTYPLYKEHRLDKLWHQLRTWRLQMTLENSLPSICFLFPLLLSVFALKDRSRWVFAFPALGFVAFYVAYVFYYPHYVVIIAPVMIFLSLVGMEVIIATWPEMRRALSVLIVLSAAGVAASVLPEFHPGFHDEYPKPELAAFNRRVVEISDPRAAVLIGYASHGDQYTFIPIYTTTAAWPDDARIVLARDYGDIENSLLYGYYASIQPERHFYRYDAYKQSLLNLGTAAQLHQRFPPPRQPSAIEK